MVPLEPAAATARTRHWCSFEPDGKHGSGVTYRSVMTPFQRRSRSGVCSNRTLGPQVPAEGAYMAQSKKRKDKCIVNFSTELKKVGLRHFFYSGTELVCKLCVAVHGSSEEGPSFRAEV